jgi:hypothetical protein
MGMIRKALLVLLAVLIAAPSFAAPVEMIRLETAPAMGSAPMAAGVAAMGAPSLSAALAPSAQMNLSVAAALPTAAPALAPVLAATPLLAVAVPAAPAQELSFASARGPPSAAASARTEAGVAARVADAVRSWGVPVEELLTQRDVLLIGEDHSSLTTIETLAREMPRLAKAGVTAVGIEGLKRPNQQAVDDYVERRTDVLPRAALGFSPARLEAFTGLLNSARDNGVRVVALGLPLNDWAAQVAELAAKKTGDPAESFGTDFVSQVDRAENGYEHGFNEALVEVLLTRRNRTMAELAWNSMGQGGKAVIVAGQAHVPGPDVISAQRFHLRGDYGDLSRELAAFALRAYSLTFTGGLFTTVQAARDDREVRPEAHKTVAAASPDGAPAFVPLGPDQGLWHAGGRSPVLAH